MAKAESTLYDIKLIKKVVADKRKGLFRIDIIRNHNISEHEFAYIMKEAVRINLITENEYASLIHSRKLHPSIIKNIIKDIREGVPRDKIIKKYDIKGRSYYTAMNRAVDLKYLTEKERQDLNEAKKLYPPFVKVLLEARLGPSGDGSDGMFLDDIVKEYDVGKTTIYNAMKMAVKLGYTTKKKIEEVSKTILKRNFEGSIKKYGDKKARQMRSNTLYQTAGKYPDFFKESGSLGGIATQRDKKKSKKVQKNLLKRVHPGTISYFYKGEKFNSTGERLVGALLPEYGLIDKIRKGINFQVPIGIRKRIDFVVKGKAVEFHSYTGDGDHNKNYEKERVKELIKEGFKGDIIVIPKISEIYEGLEKLGIKDDFGEYLRKKKDVIKKIEDYGEKYADKIKLWEKLKAEKYRTKPGSASPASSQRLKERPSLDMLAFAYR